MLERIRSLGNPCSVRYIWRDQGIVYKSKEPKLFSAIIDLHSCRRRFWDILGTLIALLSTSRGCF